MGLQIANERFFISPAANWIILLKVIHTNFQCDDGSINIMKFNSYPVPHAFYTKTVVM